MQTTRDVIDSFEEFKGMGIYITEFNTSYIPNCPLHDTNQNAAYLAQQLSRLGDVNESYSYWTFGDIFEEQGVPFTPFHGGFGLVANGCIPKPAFWTFSFFKELEDWKGECVHRSEESVILKKEDGSYAGIIWNADRVRCGRELDLTFTLQGLSSKAYCLVTKLVDEKTCNPLKVWHDLGEPASLSKDQKKLLQESARPEIVTQKRYPAEKKLELDFCLEEFGVLLFELQPVVETGDRGYNYDRVMRGETIK